MQAQKGKRRRNRGKRELSMTQNAPRCCHSLSRGLFAACLAAAFIVVGTPHPVAAQLVGPTPRLYVLDCGRLTGRNLATYELPSEVRDLSVPCFLIVHEKGMLLWEAGLGDRFAGGGESSTDPGWRVSTTLRGQLAEIGVEPADITFFAMSHSHADHTGNANDYAGSIWLVQEAERNAALAPGRNTSSYGRLAASGTVILNGDHDVFGDGTVVLMSTPGHTAGHQSLLVKLARTGPVLLSGDLYHYPEQRASKTFASFELDRAQSAASRAVIERFLTETGTALWIGHDIRTIDALRKAPAFHD